MNIGRTRKAALAMAAALACGGGVSPAFAADAAAAYLSRPPLDDVIYFLLPDRFENADPANDRGGFKGDRLATGFDPTHKGFFHGGDLKGLISRLDYIEGLGATAIWIGPIYGNKPVQGPPGKESAGYHGYWITDFTRVDPHFGSNADMRTFIEAAHARGIKVYLDIVINHTADVIALRECHDPAYSGADKPAGGCPYRSKADYPYSTRGSVFGPAINDGFQGDQPPFQTTENFARLTRADFAYTPFIPAGEENAKTPAWLNDPRYYHNRGDSDWVGESALYGDFAGLDDLFTEHPRVLEGFIEIYGDWIETFRVDGFRIDTARHVAPEFWAAFCKAMLDRAASLGIANFYIFGEVADPSAANLARHTRVDKLPYVLDFAFQSAVQDVIVNGAPARRLAELFAFDALYEGGEATARRLPVFISNHDMGRFATFISEKHPDASDSEKLMRLKLAHAMMFFLRGVPVIYAGDEQGFNGDGNDQDAREDMFASRVASYNDNDLVGTDATTAMSNFDRKHPLYRFIAEMAAIYKAHEPLRRGAQIVRAADNDGGVIAVSRRARDGGEYLVVFNASGQAKTLNIAVDPRSQTWEPIHGSCDKRSAAPGSVNISAPAFGFIVCKSNE
ncbi:MAG: alpha-amylase [Alphaproteobacteria bacterium]|nr:MAG: alpha-amylase [Alphaproteobacteria bacterium]